MNASTRSGLSRSSARTDPNGWRHPVPFTSQKNSSIAASIGLERHVVLAIGDDVGLLAVHEVIGSHRHEQELARLVGLGLERAGRARGIRHGFDDEVGRMAVVIERDRAPDAAVLVELGELRHEGLGRLEHRTTVGVARELVHGIEGPEGEVLDVGRGLTVHGCRGDDVPGESGQPLGRGATAPAAEAAGASPSAATATMVARARARRSRIMAPR